MSDTETVSPAALLHEFDKALEDRLIPQQAKPDIAIDPRLKSLFTDAVARALDVIDLTSEEVCNQFAILAADGVDLVRPAHVKINSKFEVLLPRPDRNIPVRPPTVAEDDMPFGVRW